MQIQTASNVMCGICYENIQGWPQHMVCCNSQHTLHSSCLVRWLAVQYLENKDCVCPFCRKLIFTHSDFQSLYLNTPVSPPPKHIETDTVVVHTHHEHFDALRFMRINYQAHLCMIINIFLLLVLLFHQH